MKSVFIMSGLFLLITWSSAQEWIVENRISPEYDSIIYKSGCFFGGAVDIDGDYAVVGDRGYNNAQGCVFVFHYNGAAWEMIDTLTYSEGNPHDWLGVSVGICNDVIVAGAIGDNMSGNQTPGYVCVFKKSGDTWSSMAETALLTSTDGESSDLFGCSLDINEEMVAVGASGKNNKDYADGSVYLFEKPKDGWKTMNETVKISASDGEFFSNFGSEVKLAKNEIFIGAMNDNTYNGAVYIFTKSESGWLQPVETAKLSAPQEFRTYSFGASIDVNNDVLVVGAPGRTDRDRGYAYLYEKPSGGWTDTTEFYTLYPADPYYIDAIKLGASVVITKSTVLVGAYNDDLGYKDTGSIFVFNKSDSGWSAMSECYKLTANNPLAYDQFGYAMALSGNKLIVGAIGYPFGLDPSIHINTDDGILGSAYFFHRNFTDIISVDNEKIAVYPNPTTGEIFINTNDVNVKRVLLYTITGQKILDSSDQIDFNSLDLSGYKAGIYILHIQEGDDILTTRIIKK